MADLVTTPAIWTILLHLPCCSQTPIEDDLKRFPQTYTAYTSHILQLSDRCPPPWRHCVPTGSDDNKHSVAAWLCEGESWDAFIWSSPFHFQNFGMENRLKNSSTQIRDNWRAFKTVTPSCSLHSTPQHIFHFLTLKHEELYGVKCKDDDDLMLMDPWICFRPPKDVPWAKLWLEWHTEYVRRCCTIFDLWCVATIMWVSQVLSSVYIHQCPSVFRSGTQMTILSGKGLLLEGSRAKKRTNWFQLYIQEYLTNRYPWHLQHQTP